MTSETGGLELASTIILVLQANRLTKCASHPTDTEVFKENSARSVSSSNAEVAGSS